MKLVVKKISNGRFQFALIASDGQVVVISEPHPRQGCATELIASIRKNAKSPSAREK